MSIEQKCLAGARCTLYARTAAAGDKAVEEQLARARAAVADRGGVLVGEHWDVNVSGAGALGPGLAALLAEVASGGIDLVVVTGLARLGRSPCVLGVILAAIERSSARVLTVEQA